MEPDDWGTIPPPPPSESVVVRYPLFSVRITYILLALNILVFSLILLFGNQVYGWGGLIPRWVLSDGQVWRLLTAGFIHADMTHLFFNMYALYILGQDVERLFGPVRFIVIYLLALLGGNLLVVWLGSLDTLTVGASGAILGLLGALVAYFWRYRDNLVGAQGRLTGLLITVFINVGLGLLPRVSLWGHLGGILMGLIAGLVILPHYHLSYEPTPHLSIEPVGQKEWLGSLLMGVSFLLLLILAFWLRV